MGRKRTSKDGEFVDLLVSIGMAELATWQTASEQARRSAMRLLAHEVCVLCGKQSVYGLIGISDVVLLRDWRDRGRWPAGRTASFLHELTCVVIEFGKDRLTDDLQMPPEAALLTMKQIAWRLLDCIERDTLYIPADSEFEKKERDQQIVKLIGKDGPNGARKYSMARAQQVARQFGITYQHLRLIVTATSLATTNDLQEVEHG